MTSVAHDAPTTEHSSLPLPTVVVDLSPSVPSLPTSAQPALSSSTSTPASEPAEKAEDPIDMDIFSQILELDEPDDETYEFSVEMVKAYFAQAQTTLGNMDSALDSKDLSKLSQLGHFLKGSSAALGVHKVVHSCERIQHLGALRDVDNDEDVASDVALDKITDILGTAKVEYGEAQTWLKDWYEEKGLTLDDES